MKSRLPKGYGGGMNQMQMAKKLQEMQEKMEVKTQELGETEFSSSVGGGMVQATVNGNKEVVRLNIKPEAVDVDDIEMMQDLIISAVNEALRRADEETKAQMDQITAGISIPGII